MEFINQHFLSFIVFTPAVFGVLLGLYPQKGVNSGALVKYSALFFSLIVFVASIKLFTGFDVSSPGFQYTETIRWIEQIGVSYSLGVDGISLPLVLLTTFLTPIVILGSWTAVENKLRSYYALILILETGMLGAFVALDTILFYVFWEAMLIPMYFLIGVWGGKERVYASMKFFIFTLVGSLLMLVAIFYLMSQHQAQFGHYSASIIDLYKVQIPFEPRVMNAQVLMFMAFALAFAIKVPLFPLHTWLPDAHVQAPTAGSVILAGVLLKLGGYGFIRFAFPLFPQAVQYTAPLFMTLGVIAIIYGALIAMVQPDIKKLVAYSSVSHMGYVIIGLFSLTSEGVAGAIYQMLSHGISTGGLFLIVGMLYERRHTRAIADFGGLAKTMPMFTIVFMIVTLSSIALPGTNGFVGEFLILLGVFKANKLAAVLAGTGVIFGAVYMLWMFKRVMYGPITIEENKKLDDLSVREYLVMAPIIIAIFVMGIYPALFFSKMETSIATFLNTLKVL